MAKKVSNFLTKAKKIQGIGTRDGITSAIGNKMRGPTKFAKMGKKNG